MKEFPNLGCSSDMAWEEMKHILRFFYLTSQGNGDYYDKTLFKKKKKSEHLVLKENLAKTT